MSLLLEEAIAEAKKIKELAEQTAKNKIIEEISPVIKEMLNKEIMDLSNSKLLFEEEIQPQLPTDLNSSNNQNTSLNPPLDNTPIQVGNKESNTPMPDQDGKVVVDFDSLFNQPTDNSELTQSTEPAPTEELPASVPPPSTDNLSTVAPTNPVPNDLTVAQDKQAESLTYENYSIELEKFKTNFNSLTETKNINELKLELVKEKLFSLYENLEELFKNNKVPQKIKELNEKKIESFYKKLKELKNNNNYNRSNTKQQEGKTDMKSFKDFAKELLEEGEQGFNDKLKPVEGSSEKHASEQDKHAEKVSNPSVDNSEKEMQNDGDPEEKFWDEELKKLEEELSLDSGENLEEVVDDKKEEEVQEASTKESSDDEDVVYELDEKELAEAIRSLKKENLKKKMKALKEEFDALDECGEQMMDEMPMSSTPMMEKDVQGTGTLDLKLSLDDEPGMESDLFVGGDEEEVQSPDVHSVMLDDEEVEDEEMPMAVSSLKENKSSTKELKVLKEQLAESNLLNAKLVYLNKFLQKDSLSRKQKQKIVEYLDNAKTLAEAKTTYERIKKVLEEATPKTKLMGGSSSRVLGSSGSATIKESVNSNDLFDVERMQKLSGIIKRTK